MIVAPRSTPIRRGNVVLSARVWALLEDAARAAGVKLRVMQGSWSVGTAASANTHAGGGAADLSVAGMTDSQQLRFALEIRKRGGIAWIRNDKYGKAGTGPHIHVIIRDEPGLSPAAMRQVVDFENGLNGLVSRRPDPHPRPKWTPFVIPGTEPTTMGKPDDDWLSHKDTVVTKIRTNKTVRIAIDGKTQFNPEETGRGGVAQYANVKLPPAGSEARAAIERGIVRTWFQQVEKGKEPDITGLNNARRVGLFGNRRLTFADYWPHTKKVGVPWEFCFFIEAWTATGQPVDIELDLATREVKIVGEDD